MFRRRRSVPLVSRRLSEACRDPSAWPELELMQATFKTVQGTDGTADLARLWALYARRGSA